MTAKRAYYALLVTILILGAAFLGGTYEINALLQGQASHLVALKAKLAAVNQEQISLVQAKKEINQYTNLYNIAKIVVPANKDQAQAVRQIVNLASQNGVSLDSITFPSSSLGGTVIGSLAPVAGSNPTLHTGNPALSQLTPVPKIPGVYDLQITITSATEPGHLATYPQLIGFLKNLENNRLTAIVSSISIAPNPLNHGLFSFDLTVEAYIKPGA